MRSCDFALIATLALGSGATVGQDSMPPQPTQQQLRIEQQWSHSLPPAYIAPNNGARHPYPPSAGVPGHRPGQYPAYPQQGYHPGYAPGYGQPPPPGYGQPGYDPYYPPYAPPGVSYGSTTYRLEPTGPYQYWRRPGWDFTRPQTGRTFDARRSQQPIRFPCLEGRPCNQ